MYEENYLVKALAYRSQARLLFAENTELVRTACNLRPRPMYPVLRVALSRTVSAASLLTGILKDNQRVSLKIKTSHPDYKIFADADSWGNVRGYISDELLNAPQEYLRHISLEKMIGPRGSLQITKDIGMGGTFTGITDMPYGNIVDDLSYYFQQSEQTPTFFSLSIEMDHSGSIVRSRGVMAQLLPGGPIELIDRIKHDLLFSNFEDMQAVGKEPVRLFCGCSKDMLTPMLRALDKRELTDAYAEGRSIEIVCHVCGKSYQFQPDEIAGISGIQ
ncbi:Hsp33 family molecular chaperone HslO [Paenibacillus sp. sptzw28]|uniref:Hsp33 family molecular chaperone HslO n=1 Tax=Paenibacillus sp. sptzw28 TaxID=715179 RepID=UPI001C6F09E4|nr:Hsp33 family molecular chaperone HslO [Paenibacillus sp. sptzw28]QYR21438.1 Hsp33 family molecular chaperone HslO [Paenibacillus sp. sptzw28]